MVICYFLSNTVKSGEGNNYRRYHTSAKNTNFNVNVLQILRNVHPSSFYSFHTYMCFQKHIFKEKTT